LEINNFVNIQTVQVSATTDLRRRCAMYRPSSAVYIDYVLVAAYISEYDITVT